MILLHSLQNANQNLDFIVTYTDLLMFFKMRDEIISYNRSKFDGTVDFAYLYKGLLTYVGILT